MTVFDIEQLLSDHGVKPTPQRAVITDFLVQTHSHPTADDVFAAVADKLPVPLSRATVYNTLNILVQHKVVQEVFTEPGKARYDANLSDHHHFVDSSTGQVIDVDLENITNLPIGLRQDFLGGKFELEGYQITFFGKKKD
ncbi:MAG: transcriptional repressor [Cyanobacteria bacterium SZAS LIN-2]|nr:transcriptional repressor [Cyanobacteria bacterium SZAS LIN-3]MBS1997518.1 transcriptional repressor [Cyanobacteria bacterium SZAS LIN-2]